MSYYFRRILSRAVNISFTILLVFFAVMLLFTRPPIDIRPTQNHYAALIPYLGHSDTVGYVTDRYTWLEHSGQLQPDPYSIYNIQFALAPVLVIPNDMLCCELIVVEYSDESLPEELDLVHSFENGLHLMRNRN